MQPSFGKLAIITGGSRGIGAATAKLMAKSGYNLCVTYLSNRLLADQLANQLEQQYNIKAVSVRADLSIEGDIVDLFNNAYSMFGSIDVLINNAGISGDRTKLVDMESSDLRQVIDVNLIGSFICIRECVRYMGRSYGGIGGSIVNVSSVATHTGGYHLSHYVASKSAILSMNKSLLYELSSEGIRINSVSPGVIDTDQNKEANYDKIRRSVPLQRMGQPLDVAQTIVWLISDQASYITGIDIPVSGGK